MDCRDRSYPEFDPAKGPFTVCPLCDGTGTHVNPDIDRHGLTADDFLDDPDFEEEYKNGTYEIVCRQCRGLRVIPDTKEYHSEVDGLREDDALWDSEMRHCYGPNY